MTTRGSTEKMGPLQWKLLLWLGELNGIKVDVLSLNSRTTTEALVHFARLDLDWPIQVRKSLKATQLGNANKEYYEVRRDGRIVIPWSAEKFLQRRPSRSESANISDALKKLSSRGLVYLEDIKKGKGAKSRTWKVWLTPTGVEVCRQAFTDEINKKIRESDERFEKLKANLGMS